MRKLDDTQGIFTGFFELADLQVGLGAQVLELHFAAFRRHVADRLEFSIIGFDLGVEGFIALEKPAEPFDIEERHADVVVLLVGQGIKLSLMLLFKKLQGFGKLAAVHGLIHFRGNTGG